MTDMEPKKSIPIKGWRWIFFIIGIIFGILNVAFWVYYLILHSKMKDKWDTQKYFAFFWWGVFVSVLLGIAIIVNIIF
ncbi:MAG TPA: hypothetical protein VJ461_05815 [Candidatus Nanoarchaeia archaeon]|nr:hypothetical protein [Candidatus Nanoarchaeia archaeon]